MALGLTSPALAAEEAPAPAVEILVDGEAAPFSGYAYDGVSYVPFAAAVLALRDDAEVKWAQDHYAAEGEGLSLALWSTRNYLVVNDRYLYLEDGVKLDTDRTILVPVRALCKALGVTVEWTGKVELSTTDATPLAAEDRPYSDEDLDLMSRVIMHESGYQPFLGMMAVGSVIMNRVNSSSFSDTVSGVIYEKNQFPGATNATPHADAILAARLVLEGANVVPGALYFNGVGKSCWASRNKTLITVIGGHAFYG